MNPRQTKAGIEALRASIQRQLEITERRTLRSAQDIKDESSEHRLEGAAALASLATKVDALELRVRALEGR